MPAPVNQVEAGAGTTAPEGGDGTARLQLTGVTVRFGGLTALDDVALTVRAGCVHGVIGPNGAGKTTLFDVVSGLRSPATGRVVLDGVDVTHWSAVRRARAGLRRTFQRAQPFGALSVEDNVLTALEWRGGGGGLLADLVRAPGRRRREDERRRRVAHVLEVCGLTAVARRPAGALPVATARLVELARALVDPPTVLLLDEPTAGLDDTAAALLGERVRRARDEEGCAVLLVEHDVAFVTAHCDRVTALDVGRVIADGTPSEVRADPAVRAAYLG